jgi:hypothetical protein
VRETYSNYRKFLEHRYKYRQEGKE